MKRYLRVIVNLFDGDGVGTAAASGESGDSNSGASTGTQGVEIRQDTRDKAKSLGLSDDLLESYQNSLDSKKRNSQPEQQTETQAEEPTEENLDEEFENLIKGKYKEQHAKKMNASFSERFAKQKGQIESLQSQLNLGNEILDIIANKYKIDASDRNALLEAVKGDISYFSEKALDNGTTATELQKTFFEEKQNNKDHEELTQLRREKAMRELDTRLQQLSVSTKEKYPDFNLQEEMNNPAFTAALDFIANRNSERNKATGKSDEVFDLTFAYEMAHADELRQQLVNRTAKAAMSAATQHVQANANRFNESVNQRSSRSTPKSVRDMSDSEFALFVENVKNGTAHIPR